MGLPPAAGTTVAWGAPPIGTIADDPGDEFGMSARGVPALDDDCEDPTGAACGAGSGLGAAPADPEAGCGDGSGLVLWPAARASAGPDRTLSSRTRASAPPAVVRRRAVEGWAIDPPDPPCRRRHSKCRARNSLSIRSATTGHDTPPEECYQPFPAMQGICPLFRRSGRGRMIGLIAHERSVERTFAARPPGPAQAADHVAQSGDRQRELARELLIADAGANQLQCHQRRSARLDRGFDVLAGAVLFARGHGPPTSRLGPADRRPGAGSRSQAAPRSRVARSRGGPGTGTPTARSRPRADGRGARRST